MYLLRPQKIEDLVIHTLLKGEISTSLLLEEVRKAKPLTTKQGFYAALRKLKKEDIVITYKKKASLNTTWLKDMQDKLNIGQSFYTSKNASSDFLSLEDKESVIYNFSSIRNMDTFWGHTWNVITGFTPSREPLFVYDPHYWFFIARNELERKFHREITGSKRQFLMTVAGKTALDKTIKKYFNNSYLQCNLEDVFGKNTYYMTIIGDYIAESYFDPETAARIEKLFLEHATADETVKKELKEILESKHACKLKISRNKDKALKLKRKLGKNFYIIQ